MCWIKYFGIFCVIYLELLCSVNGKDVEKGVQRCRFTKVECWTSGKTLIPGYKCFVRAYSRSYAPLNVDWKFNRPLTDFKVNLTMDYKYVTTYRQIIQTPDADFCSILSGKSVTSVFFNMVFDVLRGSGHQNIIHLCPYNDIIAYNVTISGDNMRSVFPSGDYRSISLILYLKSINSFPFPFSVTGSIFDPIDPKIVVIRVSLVIVSPIKTSF